jgi:hypothetical protein
MAVVQYTRPLVDSVARSRQVVHRSDCLGYLPIWGEGRLYRCPTYLDLVSYHYTAEPL